MPAGRLITCAMILAVVIVVPVRAESNLLCLPHSHYETFKPKICGLPQYRTCTGSIRRLRRQC
jgi:hypothetical protein